MGKYIVADRFPNSLEQIKVLIQKYDNQAICLTAFQFNEIRTLIAAENPDFIFVNLELSQQPGLALCQKLTSDTAVRHIPVVLYCDQQAQEKFSDAIPQSGAWAFFPLPFNEVSFRMQMDSIKKIVNLNITYKANLNNQLLLQTIVENAPFEIWARDKNEIGILENNASVKHFGSILGLKPQGQNTSSNTVQIWRSNNKKVFSGEILKEECEFEHNGIKKNYLQVIVPVVTDNSVEGIVGFNIDITEQKLGEKAREESEKSYRKLIETLPDGVYKSTHQGQFVEVNNAMVKMLGYNSREELLAIDIKSELYFQPEDRESVMLQEKYEEMGIFRLRKKDGSEIWVEDHGWYILGDMGEILFHEGIMRDITERKIAEEALRESEERFKMLYEQAPVGYQSLDEMGIILDVNQTWQEMTGYSKNMVIGTNFGLYLTPESNRLFHDQCPQFRSSGSLHTKFDMIRKNGSIITVQVDGRIGHAPSGKLMQAHCVLSDITDRLKAEKAVADEKILLRTLINNIPDAIYVKNTKGQKLISNKADQEILGFESENEALGKTDLEVPYRGDAKQTIADDMFVIQHAQPILNKVESFTDAKGFKRFFLTTKIPLANESGEIIGLVGVGHDITAQKNNEQKILQLLKGIEQSPASIIITDTLGNIEYVNTKLIEISGYSFDEIKGINPRIFQSGYTTDVEYANLWETIKSGNEYRGELLNRKRNGELFWESVLISPIRDEEGNIVNYMAIKEDITSRKKSDLEIRKLSVAIEQNPASVIITNTEGVIEYVNNKFLTISGYTREELTGKVIRILKPGHTPEDTYVQIWNSLLSGNEWKGEHQNRKKNRERYWESVLISPIKNESGKVTNFIILSEDISDRKKMEKDLISAKEKAEESDRLKSAFLANMSHEIRTPLNSILGFSDLLTAKDLDQQSREEFANLINSSGSNLLAIINDILDISKIEAGQIRLVINRFSANQLITDIQKEYSFKAVSKGIELRLAQDSSTPELFLDSDEARIKQVLINFVGNALKFTDKGYIEIGLKLYENSVQFYVKDTGIGIPEEYHDKIFDRFRQVESAQTRKYGGNGLGLAITKNLAELLGGKIHLESAYEKGSTFYFTLPSCYLSHENISD